MQLGAVTAFSTCLSQSKSLFPLSAHPIKGEAQQEWKRSSMEELRKRAEEHCGEGIPEEAQFFELG